MKITASSVIQNATDFISLPEIYTRINNKLDDENSSDIEIGALISIDTALTTKLLRLVNSSYFGLAVHISDVSHAVTMVGRKEVKSLLLGGAVKSLFNKPEDSAFLSDFWRHSVRTALFARILAKEIQIDESAEVLFTAGMLHDIGRLLLRSQLPEQQQQIDDLIQNESIAPITAEFRILGFDHTKLGSLLIRSWDLSDNLYVPVRYHHFPKEADSHIRSSELLALANMLAEYELEEDEDILGINPEVIEVCEQLRLPVSELPSIYQQVDDYMDMVLGLLQ